MISSAAWPARTLDLDLDAGRLGLLPRALAATPLKKTSFSRLTSSTSPIVAA